MIQISKVPLSTPPSYPDPGSPMDSYRISNPCLGGAGAWISAIYLLFLVVQESLWFDLHISNRDALSSYRKSLTAGILSDWRLLRGRSTSSRLITKALCQNECWPGQLYHPADHIRPCYLANPLVICFWGGSVENSVWTSSELWWTICKDFGGLFGTSKDNPFRLNYSISLNK